MRCYINLEGTWEFSNNETEITFFATRAAGDTEDMAYPFTIGSGVISTASDRLAITTDDGVTVEFRKK